MAKANESNTGRDLDAMAQPLARALGNIRTTLAGWDKHAIGGALAAMESCSPLDPDDVDLCAAEGILRDALDHVNAELTAKTAPYLCVDVVCKAGRWGLHAWHNQNNVMRCEFETFEEAKAAGETLHAFLKLESRAGEFCWQMPKQPHGAAMAFDDTEVPF